MRNLNMVILIGNTVATPEDRSSKGWEITNFRIAVNETSTKSSFFKCTCFGNTAKFAMGLEKGDRISITGNLVQRDWRDDQDKFREEVKIIVKDIQILNRRKNYNKYNQEDNQENNNVIKENFQEIDVESPF
jgi:single stranded DNA-binding protein